MRTGLINQQSIDSPPTINPNDEYVVLAHLVDAHDIGCFHAQIIHYWELFPENKGKENGISFRQNQWVRISAAYRKLASARRQLLVRFLRTQHHDNHGSCYESSTGHYGEKNGELLSGGTIILQDRFSDVS